MKLTRCLLLLGYLLLCVGCGSKRPTLYPVTGKVFDGEKPAVGALVIFHPVSAPERGGAKPVGKVGEAGDFTLSWDNYPGAPAGDYVVTVHWRKPKQNPFEAEQPDLLEGRFATPSTSKLRATVTEGPTILPPFRVDE